jgi:hypothetical protein
MRGNQIGAHTFFERIIYALLVIIFFANIYFYNHEVHMDTADTAYKIAIEKYETDGRQMTSAGWWLITIFCFLVIGFYFLVN